MSDTPVIHNIPTIAKKIRESIMIPVEHMGLCSGTIAEALRDKKRTTGVTIATALSRSGGGSNVH